MNSFYDFSLKRRKRNALVTTETELKLIARPANIGLSSGPQIYTRTPLRLVSLGIVDKSPEKIFFDIFNRSLAEPDGRHHV